MVCLKRTDPDGARAGQIAEARALEMWTNQLCSDPSFLECQGPPGT